MATVTEKPQPPQPAQPKGGAEQQLVDQQISRTRRALKFVDLTAGLITLAIGVLAFLLTMAVLEHWVIPGGWSDTARFLLFSALIAGCAWYCWFKFWPLVRQPINPVYAAQAIEQSSPSLKNSLLNLLLLRTQQRRMSRQVYQAIETQAAQGLSQVRMETVVDRSIILRLGYILVALTAICVLYRVLSPKDLFSSAGRVLLPWSDISTPSRVNISNVTPGDSRVARGDQLKVMAEVLGLETDEAVQLLYTTADKQIVKQAIPMTGSDSGTLFSCKVPAHIGGGDRRGVQQDFTYWIEAGDARSPQYSINVFARPTLVVSRLRYDYPAYTGFPSREVEHTGDIRAVEGTRVTLFAEANKPIKSAHIDFGADGRHDLLMKSTDQQATATFPLALREDRRTPEHRSYVLKYLTTDGTRNQMPPKYQIDVQPDYAPEIQLLLPEEPMLEVAVNKEINFELEARDPDFALNQVLLVGKVGEEQKVQEPLLERTHTGKFVGKLRKTPEQLGLQPGDVLEYWGAASDNRRPEPNLAYSAHRKIRVVAPWQGDQNQQGEGQQQGEGGGGESQDGEGGQDGQAGGGEQGNSNDGEGQEGGEGQSGAGQEGGDPGENNQQQNGGQAGSEGEQNGEQNQEGGANGNSPSDNSQNESGENSDQQNDGEQNQDGEASEDSSGGQGGEQSKVSPDGDDDSTAFERMKEHFDEQDGNSGEGQSQPNGDNAEGDRNQQQPGQGGESGDEADSGDQSAGKPGAEQDQQSDGEGAQGEPAPGEEQEQAESQGEQQPQEGESPDGKMSPEQGEGGAGDQKGQQQGAPNSEETKNPEDKQGDQGEGPREENSEAASKSSDNSESDSEGGEGGDRSGGGKEGAGQQADESGKGAAGQNEAAEDGAGKSSEQGEGETGQDAGDQEKAEGKTGESSGDQEGKGSEQGEQAGEQPGGEAASEGQQGEPGQQPNESPAQEGEGGEPSDPQPPQDESDPSDSESDGGEAAGSGGQGGSQPQSELLPEDQANLDYAKKQTDLILERLEDQLKKKDVDKDLLEKLGWSKDELRRFVDRWKNLKDKATEDTGASDELSDALRSLGLNRDRRTGYNSKITKDKLRDLQEAYRGKVPLEYQDQVNRYLKGTANAQESE